MYLKEQEKIKAIYVHIPFCKKICSYCDFCKIFYNKTLVDKYLEALTKEIKLNYKNNLIKTLYIGGGTPSSLSLDQLYKLFNILSSFKLNRNYEFTFECNIEDIDEELLLVLKENKVNRLSIGVESFNNKILKVLGRTYNFSIKDRIMLAKEYFDNINIDLIYGINSETINDLKDDLNNFLELNINHISIYSLILEDNTYLKINNYQEIDDDLDSDMYELIRKMLNRNGYIQYEISNYAKKGYESKHNLVYWNNEKYYGFGLGASGYIDNVRYNNTRNINKYFSGNYILDKHNLTKKECMENEMILGLRKAKGVSKNKFYSKYNLNINDVFDTSKLKENKKCYYIEKKYFFISNYILKDFID